MRGQPEGVFCLSVSFTMFVCLFLLRCLFLLSLELGLEPQDSGGEIVGAECGGSRRVTIADHQLFSTQDKYDIILRASSKQN